MRSYISSNPSEVQNTVQGRSRYSDGLDVLRFYSYIFEGFVTRKDSLDPIMLFICPTSDTTPPVPAEKICTNCFI